MAQFDAFVPALARARLAKASGRALKPSAERFQAAVLFADLSGSSALAERLAARGSHGAEDLKDLLNLFFGLIVRLVHEHGGQVVDFPGDAVLAVWPAGSDPSTGARSAAICGLAAQDSLLRLQTPDGSELRLRVGIGCGEVWAANVGGVTDRWHLVVAGDALMQAVQAMSAAQPVEVMVSPETWELLAPHATAQRVTRRAVRVARVSPPAVPLARPPLQEQTDSTLLRCYVPSSIQARIDAGQTDWLAEFRRLTVLFVNIGPLECTAPDALERLQCATEIVQTVVDHYGGNVGHLVADDKGTIIDCGWGLALHAHADDSVRAGRAAIEMRRRLTEVGITAAFGLTTGDVFTGLRGTHDRCDFAMIGSVVNLAAALMQASRGDIVCDASFCDAAGLWACVDPLPPVIVKGRDRPVSAYRLTKVTRADPSNVIGRVRERRMLEERLDALLDDGSSSVAIIEGDAGIGKSRLLAAMMDHAVSRGIRVVLARGDAIERSAPYHVWRGLFDTLLGIGEDHSGGEQRLVTLLRPVPRLAPFASVLNPILGLSVEETARSRTLTPRGRAALTRDLLLYLFSRAVGDLPTLLVLDDSQWFDSASWSLAEAIQRERPRLVMLIATRPVPHEHRSRELERIRAGEHCATLRLEALTAEETKALVCQLLRARALDRNVEGVLLQKAEGHPFFTEELAHTLRDRGLITVEGGVCRFSGAAAADQSTLLPNTVRVTVSSRIDQLTIPQQLTIKVASVLGRTFDLPSLGAVYPLDINADELARHVHALVELELIRETTSSASRGYEFKHAITQEVAYSLLPHAQRCELHAVVARFYEAQHASDLARFFPLLADHWGRSGVVERALFYRERAGDDALSRFANEEAIRFFNEALALDAGSAPADAAKRADLVLPKRVVSARDARRTHWYRRLGEAYVNLGLWTEGWAHLERALATAGYPLPTTKIGWVEGVAAQVATQAAHCVQRPVPGHPAAEIAELLIGTVRALQRIGSVSYVTDRKAPLFYCVLAALNLAERLPQSAELATLYSSAANIAGLIPLHRLARVYVARAQRVARALNDPAVDARILGRTSLYRLAIGDWSACGDVERSMILAEQVGDPFQWEESAAIRARAAHLRGEFDRAVQLGAEIRKRSLASGTAVHEIWGIDAEAWGFLYLGEHAKALERVHTGLARPGRGDRIATLDLLGVSALAHLYRGDVREACEAADRITADLQQSPRPGHFAVLGMSAAAEVYIALANADARPGSRSDLVARARRIVQKMERYARINPPARARALLWRGCAEWMDGRASRAHKTWRECLADAERFALPYELARAHYEIGRTLGRTDPMRTRHLEQAEIGFRGVSASFELARVEAARAGDAKGAAVMW